MIGFGGGIEKLLLELIYLRIITHSSEVQYVIITYLTNCTNFVVYHMSKIASYMRFTLLATQETSEQVLIVASMNNTLSVTFDMFILYSD
jgi:hypothetical protein